MVYQTKYSQSRCTNVAAVLDSKHVRRVDVLKENATMQETDPRRRELLVVATLPHEHAPRLKLLSKGRQNAG